VKEENSISSLYDSYYFPEFWIDFKNSGPIMLCLTNVSIKGSLEIQEFGFLIIQLVSVLSEN